MVLVRSSLQSALHHFGGVAAVAVLEASGISRADIRGAVVSGSVHRVRQGWVALPTAPAQLVRAVRIGGRVSCISLLQMHKVWCLNDHRLHVAVGRDRGHLASPLDRSVPLGRPERFGIEIHRDQTSASLLPLSATDSIASALSHATKCQAPENALVAIDSALNKGLLTLDELRSAFAGLPERRRQLLELADATAQSGLETKARLRLRGLGIPVRAQARVPAVGAVDLLLGERLVLEFDGAEWHTGREAFEEDRRRNLELYVRDYLVYRFSYSQVMYEWPRIEALVRLTVSRREHRWAPRHRSTADLRMDRTTADRDAYGRDVP